MTIALLYGGKSGEHEVSLRSSASVARHVKPGHTLVLIGIDHDGAWYLQPKAVLDDALAGDNPLGLVVDGAALVSAIPGRGLALAGSSSPIRLDVVFPVLHGTFGEDGTIQGLLELSGVPYIGCDVLGSAVGMDKEMAKNLWDRAGLPVVPFVPIRKCDLSPQVLEKARVRSEAAFGYPMFVKPTCSGSSVGTSKVADAAGFDTAVRAALEWDFRALVEPFIAAREIECSVIGNGTVRSFLPGEIVPRHEFYDYEAKYIDPDGAALIIPADIPPETAARVRNVAERAYVAAGLNGMARVDFFLDKRTGEVYLNEVNTIPGFTSISMFPKMCEAGGLAFPDLIDELVNLAIERGKRRSELRFVR
ncbi:MAG: D-alanine--D-alanine ligase [Spirochaetes bacterium]|nr:D-alanine--D-alanine ligase [Spirochaetota bacterium]